MQRMCRACGDWHDLDEPWPTACYGKHFGIRSSAPYVISDNMPPMKHMATGETLDSKARFRQATKVAGCIELGNEPIKNRVPEKLDSGKRREAIRKAIYDLRNGR